MPSKPEERRKNSLQTPVMTMEMPTAPDEELHEKQFVFAEGAWIPDADPLTIGEKNYSAIQNLRIRNRVLEGTQGYTKINTSPLSSYLKNRSGIQLRSPFATPSRVLVQSFNAGLTASQILQNKTPVPNQGDFDALPLHIDAPGAGLGRFSHWPQNTIAYNNGLESMVYAGDEMPCAGFLTSDQDIGHTINNPMEYTEALRNSLQTVGNIAVVGGSALDKYTKVLLRCTDAVGATTLVDTSGNGHDGTCHGNAKTSNTRAKYPPCSLYIPGATGDYVSIANHADLDFLDNDFTIDWWEYRTIYSATDTVFARDARQYTPIHIYCNAGYIYWYMSQDGSVWYRNNNLALVTLNQWVHYAIVRNGSNIFSFKNGAKQPWSEAGISGALAAGNADAQIGRYQTTYYGPHAYYNEFRISNGIARWTDDFTPPRPIQSGRKYWIVGANRPLQGIKPYIKSGNNQVGCLTAQEFSGQDWTELDIVDNTNTESSPVIESNDFNNTSGWNAAAATLTSVSGGLEGGNCLKVAEAGGASPGQAYRDFAGLAAATMGVQIAFKKGTAADGKFLIGTDADPDLYHDSGALSDAEWTFYTATFDLPAGVVLRVTLQSTDATAGEYCFFDKFRLFKGKPLNATGTITWPSTVDTSKPKYLNGRFHYWYKFFFPIGEATFYQVTADAPFQPIVDLWDGSDLLCGSFLVYKASKYADYTDYVNDNSDTTYADISSLATGTEHVLMGFPVPIVAVNIRMVDGKANAAAGTDLAVAFCSGAAMTDWPAVQSLTDRTAAGGIALAQNGVVSFQPVDVGLEFKSSINGGPDLYYYKFSWDVSLTTTNGPQIYYVTGIAAPTQISAYKFPAMYRNRPLLCNSVGTGEGNRVDYGAVDSVCLFTGPDSSFGPDSSPLYFGDADELTGSVEIYNRVGSSLYHLSVFTKARETYILDGYDAETFKILLVSGNIGCPAPLTMVTVEIGYGDKPDNLRCIALWLSYSGVVMYDTAAIVPIPGLTCYFDPDDSRCINYAAIENARGYIDPINLEYNIEIPSGAGQVEVNVWLFLDLRSLKWFQKVPSATAGFPQAVIPVADTDGRPYTYGCRDNGYMMRLEDGMDWDGSDIVRFVDSSDMILAGNVWNMIRLRRIKLGLLTNSGAAEEVSVIHFADGAAAGVALTTLAQTGSNRHVRKTVGCNIVAWSHKIRFSLTTDDTTKGVKMLVWGMEYQVERKDI